MITFNASVWQFLGIMYYILGSSSILKMSLKTFENNGKNISKNILKLNLKQSIILDCMIIWSTYMQRKQIGDNLMISLPDTTENSL